VSPWWCDPTRRRNPPWQWQTLVSYPEAQQPPGHQTLYRDAVATDLVYDANLSKLFVAGATCARSPATACIEDQGDASLGSDIAFVRLDISTNPPAEDYKYRITQGPLGSATHTDVAYSVVLQAQSSGNPKVVIGGYSVDADGGTPYMSGARFTYDNPDVTSYDFFESGFANTQTGQTGDQATELQVRSNGRIVAGGFHTTTSDGPAFAAMRLCKEPGEDPCTDSPASGGGGGGNPRSPSLPPDVAPAGAPQAGTALGDLPAAEVSAQWAPSVGQESLPLPMPVRVKPAVRLGVTGPAAVDALFGFGGPGLTTIGVV
jgi:hypothetical protein